MKFGKILVSIYQPGSAAILNSIPGLEVIEGLARMHAIASCDGILSMPLSKMQVINKKRSFVWFSIVLTGVEGSRNIMKAKCCF